MKLTWLPPASRWYLYRKAKPCRTARLRWLVRRFIAWCRNARPEEEARQRKDPRKALLLRSLPSTIVLDMSNAGTRRRSASLQCTLRLFGLRDMLQSQPFMADRTLSRQGQTVPVLKITVIAIKRPSSEQLKIDADAVKKHSVISLARFRTRNLILLRSHIRPSPIIARSKSTHVRE